MTINLSVPRTENELRPKITVVGVGGAGSNAVNNMIHLNLEGVEFVCANTDAQALAQSAAERKVQLGIGITRGLGAGARPEVGRDAAEEAIGEILDHVQGSHMVFITAGMGGGTGTGAAPVIARAAREHGILTVGVVTKPFHFEGTHRMRIAEAGIEELTQFVDTLIIIPNQNLFRIATERTTFAEAFKLADDVLYSGVRGVTDLMVMPGLINLDFADIRTVMTEMGKAMMGTGEAEGEKRAIAAAEAAIANPLLDDVSMRGARGVLINVTGGADMTLYEVDEAANRIREEVDPDANIIFGATLDPTLDGRIRISMVATGIEAQQQVQPRPLSLVGGGQRPSLVGGQAQRSDTRATIAAASRAIPATAGNTALSLHAQLAPQPAVQPMPQPVAMAAPAASPVAASQPAPQPVAQPVAEPVAVEAEEEPVESPVAAQPAPQPEPVAAAPLARPAAPLAQPAAKPAASQPAAKPMGNPLTKGFVPTQQAIQAASLDRRPAQAPQAQAPASHAMAPQADTPFIAPAPVEVPETPAATRGKPVAADPFAEAALANGARAPQRMAASAADLELSPEDHREPIKERTSGLDLFKRVTGLASLRRPTAPAKPAAAQPPVAPRADLLAREPARAPQQLGGVNPADRAQPARQEDDLLDIPSFLRRQAN